MAVESQGGDHYEELRQLGHRREFRRGQQIFFEGDTRGSVLLVESGHVKIVASNSDGEEVVLTLRGPGELVGDLSVLTQSPTGAAAVALGAVSATMILGTRYRDFVESHPDLLLEQFRRLVAILRESDGKLVELTTLDVRTRVARRLLDLTALGSEPGDGGRQLTTELSHEELAAMSGASREAVSRTMADLRDRKIVRTDRRRITLIDADALRGLAGLG